MFSFIALWIMAAKWEMEDRLSSESARQLFLRALRFHPQSTKLYQEVSVCVHYRETDVSLWSSGDTHSLS